MKHQAYFKEEIVRAAQDIAHATQHCGGATYHIGRGLRGCQEGGFAVSLYKERETVIDGNFMLKNLNNLQEFVELYIKFNLDLLQVDDECYIGTWVDGTKVYLDVVKVIGNREKAELLARAHDQKAIFDLGKLETIEIGGN